MPDKKLTDAEIIKDCKNCIRYTTCIFCIIGGRSISKDCNDFVELDIINRLQAENEKNENIIRLANKTIETQKAEIERLNALIICKNKLIEGLDKSIGYAYDKGAQEFAERLKEKIDCDVHTSEGFYFMVSNAIDNLVKEMVGEQKNDDRGI